MFVNMPIKQRLLLCKFTKNSYKKRETVYKQDWICYNVHNMDGIDRFAVCSCAWS